MKNKLIIALALSFTCTIPVFAEKINQPSKSVHTENKLDLKAILLNKQTSYPKMKPVKFTLKVSEKNKPVEKASISVDLTMLDMEMPKNEIKFKEISKGVYESEGLFTMSGNWRLVTSITTGKKKQIVNFDVNVD